MSFSKSSDCGFKGDGKGDELSDVGDAGIKIVITGVMFRSSKAYFFDRDRLAMNSGRPSYLKRAILNKSPEGVAEMEENGDRAERKDGDDGSYQKRGLKKRDFIMDRRGQIGEWNEVKQ